MEKIINYCGNCPFFVSEYDDFAIGHSTIDTCKLSKYLNNEEYIISTHDGMHGDVSNTPDWCPLKVDYYSFSFKEFSKKRKEEIDNVTKEIIELSKLIDENEDYESDEFIKTNNRLTELYNMLSMLYNNEEFSEEDFTKEITDKVEDIKKYLEQLEENTLKITEKFKNLGNEENTN